MNEGHGRCNCNKCKPKLIQSYTSAPRTLNIARNLNISRSPSIDNRKIIPNGGPPIQSNILVFGALSTTGNYSAHLLECGCVYSGTGILEGLEYTRILCDGNDERDYIIVTSRMQATKNLEGEVWTCPNPLQLIATLPLYCLRIGKLRDGGEVYVLVGVADDTKRYRVLC